MFIAPIITKGIERGNMFVRELCIKDLVNISHRERGKFRAKREAPQTPQWICGHSKVEKVNTYDSTIKTLS